VYLHEHSTHKFKQKEETQKEDGAGRLPRSKTVLDHAGAILAMGPRRSRGKNRRTTFERSVQARSRRVVGVAEQYRAEFGPSKSYERSVVVEKDWRSGEVREEEVHRRDAEAQRRSGVIYV